MYDPFARTASFMLFIVSVGFIAFIVNSDSIVGMDAKVLCSFSALFLLIATLLSGQAIADILRDRRGMVVYPPLG